MIEKTVHDFLETRLSVPVLVEVPENRPDTYVLIEKTGSREENHLFQATLAIRSVGATIYEASALNNEVKTVMADIISLTNIFRCECETDYNFTDTRTKERRYQAVFHIIYKEENI